VIAYGTDCCWWDAAANARLVRTPTGDHLHCPHCGGRVALHPDRASFLRMARRFELIGFAGHYDVMTWSQGRCFKTLHEATLAYRSRPLVTLAG
jgi:hypothetical protein